LSFTRRQCLRAGDLATLLFVLIATHTGGFLFDLSAAASLSFLPGGLLRATDAAAPQRF
jgi:hypothetical protein